jgi:hypothetical protein
MVGGAGTRARPGKCRAADGRAQRVDLRDQAAVSGWLRAKRPQVVFLAAAVGGIVANNTANSSTTI